MQNNPELTAIKRVKLFSPTRILLEKGLLKGKILDFGCGRGFDTDYLRDLGLDIVGYDPYYRPNRPDCEFDVIICNYVLNVLEPDQEENVINDIKSFLKDDGTAYISVRRDVKKEGYRKHGKGFTYQRNVVLNLESVEKNGGFEIYILRKN